MTTILPKPSLCHNTVLFRDGRFHVKIHPLSPNHVSLRRSQFKFNQLPLSYERTSPVKCSPTIGSSRSHLPVLPEIGKSANNSHLSSSVGPPSLIQVPVQVQGEDLLLLCVIMLGTYHLVSGVIGVTKFIVDGTFEHLYYVLVLIRKQQLERKKLEKKIPLDREDGSVSCSD